MSKCPILKCLFLIGGGHQVNDQHGPATGMARAFRNGITLDGRPKNERVREYFVKFGILRPAIYNMKLIRVVFVLILIMEDIAIKKIKSVRCGYEFFTYNQKQNWLNIIIFYIRNVI